MNIPYNAGKKISRVTRNMGVKGIANMQGTTRLIYDSLLLTTTTSNTTLRFFENVNTRKFPFSNINENKLQVGETIAMQRFSIAVMERVIATGEIININPLGFFGSTKGLYRSDLSFQIAQDTVVKKVPLQTMYAPFNRNSNFFGSTQFTAGGILVTNEVPQDVFHFDNPIVIPPQIEFVAEWQLPPVTVTPPAGSEYYAIMTIEGLGSLFAPKSTY